MSNDIPSEETISRYLDGALLPEESDAFSRELAQNADTALAFARMARTDSLLAGAFPQRPRRRVAKSFVWAAAAAALTAGCFFALRFLPGQAPALPETARIVDAENDPLPPPGLRRRTVKPVPASSSTALSLEQLFTTFSVTADPQGLTVPQALAALEENIRELNLLGRAELATLRFSAGDALIPGQAEPVIASPVLPPFSIGTYLGICANYREIYLEPGHVLYAPRQKPQWDPRIVSRGYGVRPDFLNTWHARHPAKREPADPFTPSPDPSQPSMDEVARDYFNIAVHPLEGSTTGETRPQFRYSPAEGKLEVEFASVYVHERILNLTGWQALAAGALPQYRITCKFISSLNPEHFAGAANENGVLMDESAVQAYMRQISGTSGINVVTAPSILARSGQRAAIEQIKELTLPLKAPGGEFTFDWTGHRIEIEASPWGEFIYVRGEIDFGTEEPGPKVRHEVTGFDLWLPAHHTGLITLDQTGIPTAACITVQPVDAAGQPK